MLEAAERFETGERILLLVDSEAAISAVMKAGKKGKARTRDLARLMEAIGRREGVVGKGSVSLGWVKSHIGIHGNERWQRRGQKREWMYSKLRKEGSGKRSTGGGKKRYK